MDLGRSKRFTNKKIKHSSNRVVTRTIHIVLIAILALIITVISTNRILATNTAEVTTVTEVQKFYEFEKNENTLDLEKILNENISIIKTKEVVIEEREIPYGTVTTQSEQLPLGEESIVQEGENGLEQVKVVKNYENDVFVDENILTKTTLKESKGKLVQIGTSEFLKKHKVHVGDKLYVTTEIFIKKENNIESSDVIKVAKYLDVTLLEMAGEWCKVEYKETEGYIQCENLTSEKTTPKIVEQNRIQKLLLTLDINMALNEPSGLTLKDFQRILSNQSSDLNHIFKDNAEAFYNVEQRYNVNGVFLAALAIHESGWGTSTISIDKKNLFGYGAYDSNPYDGAYTFETYEEGVDLLGQVFAKHYINTAGTKIHNGEIATGKYYNGSSLSAINVRYSTDEEWATKVYSIMEMLYSKL